MQPEGDVLERLEIDGSCGEFLSFRTHYCFPRRTLTTNSTLRFASRAGVERLISNAGLQVHQIFGDWDGRPFDPMTSREMIFIAGKT